MRMSNQEAIEIIKLAQAQIEWDYPMDYAVAFDMTISALRAQDVPDTNVGDMVSRQKTIDAVKRLSLGETDAARLAMRIEDYLKRLPSTLPEPYREDDAK